MVHSAIANAEDQLWYKLLHIEHKDRFSIPLNELTNDVTWTKQGVSFVNNSSNGLSNKRRWALERVLSDKADKRMCSLSGWDKPRVCRYLRKVDKF